MLSEAFGESFIDAVRGIAPAIVGRTEGKEDWRHEPVRRPWPSAPPGQRKQAGDLVVGQLVDELMQFVASGLHRSSAGPHGRAERE